MRCLVVDASPTIRHAVSRALQQLTGEPPITCDDANAALAEAEPAVDLAVIGWSAADDRGLTLLRELRAHPSFISTPVVIVSSRGSHVEVRAAIDAGANDYVLRPVTPEALLERLARWTASADAATGGDPASAPANRQAA